MTYGTGPIEYEGKSRSILRSIGVKDPNKLTAKQLEAMGVQDTDGDGKVDENELMASQQVQQKIYDTYSSSSSIVANAWAGDQHFSTDEQKVVGNYLDHVATTSQEVPDVQRTEDYGPSGNLNTPENWIDDPNNKVWTTIFNVLGQIPNNGNISDYTDNPAYPGYMELVQKNMQVNIGTEEEPNWISYAEYNAMDTDPEQKGMQRPPIAGTRVDINQLYKDLHQAGVYFSGPYAKGNWFKTFGATPPERGHGDEPVYVDFFGSPATDGADGEPAQPAKAGFYDTIVFIENYSEPHNNYWDNLNIRKLSVTPFSYDTDATNAANILGFETTEEAYDWISAGPVNSDMHWDILELAERRAGEEVELAEARGEFEGLTPEEAAKKREEMHKNAVVRWYAEIAKERYLAVIAERSNIPLGAFNSRGFSRIFRPFSYNGADYPSFGEGLQSYIESDGHKFDPSTPRVWRTVIKGWNKVEKNNRRHNKNDVLEGYVETPRGTAVPDGADAQPPAPPEG